MHKKSFPLPKAYRLLGTGPTVLITTAEKGRANVMTLAWQMPMDFEPPLVGLILSDQNYSFKALKNTGECVINIPTAELLDKVVGCGNTSGRDTDKFTKFGLTPVPAQKVQPPLLEECYASLECRVVDAKLAKKYNLFILEVLKAWSDPTVKNPKTLHHRGQGDFMVAGRTVTVASKMK